MREFLDQFMPPNYSAHGGQLDDLNLYVHWLMLILFVGWGLLFAFVLVRFRASKHPKALDHGTKSHISKWAEIGISGRNIGGGGGGRDQQRNQPNRPQQQPQVQRDQRAGSVEVGEHEPDESSGLNDTPHAETYALSVPGGRPI